MNFMRIHKKKAQTSMEFVVLTGFMMLAFLIFYIVIQSKLLDANRDSIDIAVKEVESLVVNELKVAESVTDGYYREFELPQRVNGIDYTISIIAGVGETPEIVTKYSGKERVYFVPQSYVNANSTVGKGLNNITKINGKILIQHISS
ncbi:MAG: hypothetical protein ACP5OA_01660 [Candidatus Woesearchaeota archaeon]